jgi:ABC-2 type transport system ATP-binding protein
MRVLGEIGAGPASADEAMLRLAVPVTAGPKALMEALRRFDADGIEVVDIGLTRPTLDDVFLTLTGRTAEEETPTEPAKQGRRGGRGAGPK